MIPEFFGIIGERLARVSAISGRELHAGDMLVYVPGTPYFYGIEAREKHLLTPERRAAIEAQAHPAKSTAKVAEVKDN